MASIGGGSEGVEVIPPTEEELKQQCIHVWRDISQEGNKISQRCVRCGLERTITIE